MKKGFFYITDRLWTGDTVKEIVFFPLSSHGATADIYLHIYYNMNTEPFHTARFYFFLKKFSFYHWKHSSEKKGFFITDRLWTGDTAREFVFSPFQTTGF